MGFDEETNRKNMKRGKKTSCKLEKKNDYERTQSCRGDLIKTDTQQLEHRESLHNVPFHFNGTTTELHPPLIECLAQQQSQTVMIANLLTMTLNSQSPLLQTAPFDSELIERRRLFLEP